MKKITKFLVISILCIVPILLGGCQKGNYYQIEAFSSGDSSLGTVHSNCGKKVMEGQEVMLTARENNPSQNPLYCWVKNNSQIVKYAEHTPEVRDNTYSIISSMETEGKYTAIFKENADNMMYSALKSTSADTADYKYTIYYTPINAGIGESYIFASNLGEENLVSNKVLYFGSIGDNYEYTLSVQLTKIVDETTTITTAKYDLKTSSNSTIINSNFDGEIKALIAINIDFDHNTAGDEVDFTLTLAKLGYEKITV